MSAKCIADILRSIVVVWQMYYEGNIVVEYCGEYSGSILRKYVERVL